MFTLLFLACARVPASESPANNPPSVDYGPGRPGTLVLRGATVFGLGPADVQIADGRVVAVGVVEVTGAEEIDLSGRTLVPAFIDSHVHLAYYPVAGELPPGGVAGAVDLAAPETALSAQTSPLRLIQSGPMVTSVRGYPTTSWGRDGYGIECASSAEAVAAVDRLLDHGAALIKLPASSGASLDEDAIRAAVDRAHARGALTVSHALSDSEAAMAARAGVDVLAHTPVSTLSESTVSAWSDRAVISTLGAFGGDAEAVDNLRRLRASGAQVLYGTDLGNTRTAAIDPREIELMVAAGMDGAAIVQSATRDPAEKWGFETLGAIEVGKDASFLVLTADPQAQPLTLADPERVFILGSAL